MKIAAVVILYNPDVGVTDRVLSYSPFVGKVYMIDNSENPLPERQTALKQLDQCFYESDGQNRGLAQRLNEACRLAIKEGYEWLLTMDQDSAFEGNDAQFYFDCVNQFPDKRQVGVFGVQYEGNRKSTQSCEAVLARQLITSGSLVNLQLFAAVGGFDQALFIDQVDFEYCFRCIRKGFQVVQMANISLNHAIGETSEFRSLKSMNKSRRSLHTPIRLYYMTRNYLYVRERYRGHFAAELKNSWVDLRNRIKNNLLYGNKRMDVLKYVSLGFLHYQLAKMGKLGI